MSGTLRSFSQSLLCHRNITSINEDEELHVVVIIIQDGKGKASDTFKKAIVDELGCPPYEMLDGPGVHKPAKGEDSVMIMIPDAEVFYPAHAEEYDVTYGCTFHPIVVTKSRNAMKFNSHLIFFSLCNILNPDCCFLTDCGTLYQSDCLHHLISYLFKKHTTTSGVTARQRAMDSSRQLEVVDYPSWHEKYSEGSHNDSYLSKLLRVLGWWSSPAPQQAFEYEYTCIMSTAMFNVIGCHPVLPGPCQLLWWSHLKHEGYNTNHKSDDGTAHVKFANSKRKKILQQAGVVSEKEGPLDMYFRHLMLDPIKSGNGLIKTSTLLAEDRILSMVCFQLCTHKLCVTTI